MRPDRLPISKEKLDEILELNKKEIPYIYIAKIVGVSQGTVSNYLSKINGKKFTANTTRSKYKDYNWTNQVEHKDTIGIYILFNTVSNMLYIGSSSDLHRRLYLHYSRLHTHSHENIRIQQDFDNYGINSFQCEIIGILDTIEEATEIEHSLILTCNLDRLYNDKNNSGNDIIIDNQLTNYLFNRLNKIDSGCWIYTGMANKGYGLLVKSKYIPVSMRKGKSKKKQIRISAHKYSYVLHTGQQVPHGLVLHHKCNNKLCVNPEHLEPTSTKKNILEHRLSYQK